MFYFVISMQKNNTSRKMHGAEKLQIIEDLILVVPHSQSLRL